MGRRAKTYSSDYYGKKNEKHKNAGKKTYNKKTKKHKKKKRR